MKIADTHVTVLSAKFAITCPRNIFIKDDLKFRGFKSYNIVISISDKKGIYNAGPVNETIWHSDESYFKETVIEGNILTGDAFKAPHRIR